MSLTVGIDARKIRDYGIGRYLQGLIGGLSGLEGDERYVLFLADESPAALPAEVAEAIATDRFRTSTCAAGLYSVRELFAFRGAARRHGLDVLHFPHYVRAFAPGCAVAVTIHDAIHLSHPPSAAARIYARAMMGWAARSADALLTVSETARQELSRRLSVPAARFTVTPNGVGPAFAPPSPEAVARLRAERGLRGDFVLCMASHRPHKNLAGAVEAFRQLGAEGAELVVPARDPAAVAAIEACADPRAFRILESVRDEDLPPLYAAARVVLVPSLEEGFGLPALEAAACGGAVLATDIPAHREVLGSAASFARSGHPADLADALGRLWDDPEERERLARAGPRRAAEFRWERTARLTRDAYHAAARVRGSAMMPRSRGGD